MRAIGLGILLAAFLGTPAGAQPPHPPDAMDIANSIMSPVCDGRLISNCPSAESEQLRELIRQLIAQGKSKQEIVDHFVDLYGEEVLPSPPQRGFFLTAWYLPLAGILSGGGVLYVLIRAWSRGEEEEDERPSSPESPTDQRYTDILDEELKDFDA